MMVTFPCARIIVDPPEAIAVCGGSVAWSLDLPRLKIETLKAPRSTTKKNHVSSLGPAFHALRTINASEAKPMMSDTVMLIGDHNVRPCAFEKNIFLSKNASFPRHVRWRCSLEVGSERNPAPRRCDQTEYQEQTARRAVLILRPEGHFLSACRVSQAAPTTRASRASV